MIGYDQTESAMTKATKEYRSDGSHLAKNDPIWEAIRKRARADLVNMTFFELQSEDRLRFSFLNEVKAVDLANGCILERRNHRWIESDDPLLALATGVYLKNIGGVYPMGQDIVGAKDLKEGHFFVGPHELRVGPILKRFGHDVDGFKQAAVTLGGVPLGMADAAYRLLPFPRVPLYYLLWQGDDEFEPRVDVLFDRSIEKTFPADAIWALVSRVSAAFGMEEA